MIRKGVALAFCLTFAGTAAASDRQDGDDDAEESDDDDNDDDAGEDDPDMGPWKVPVPSELRGQGYVLRVDEDEIPLDADTITLKGSNTRQNLELSQKGRVHASRIGYLDKFILEELEPRSWRLGLFAGGTTVNGQAFRRILQDSHLNEFSVGAAWQPQAYGLELQIASQSSDQEHGHGVVSTYSSSQTRLSAIYEIAPFRASRAFLRKLHMVGRAGLFSASHRIEIGDNAVKLKDDDASAGALVGLDCLYNINNFWVGLRGYMSYQEIEFKVFDFKTQAVQRSLQIGGDYAF